MAKRLRRAPRPPAAGLWLAVRAGAADSPARLDGAFATALPLPEARRVSRLRGAPAGILIFFPAADAAGEVAELLAWLRDLPAAVKTTAYAPAAPDDALLQLARLVDALLVDVSAADGPAAAGAADFARLYRLLAPQVRVVPKLWVGRADGDLAPDYLLLDEICLAGEMRRLRLALNFSADRGPGSPEAVQRFAAETIERFGDGAGWGAFAPTQSYLAHLDGISAALGWPPHAWDCRLPDADRLRTAGLLL